MMASPGQFAPSSPVSVYPGPGYPTQGYPTQGYPAQGYPTQSYPAQRSAPASRAVSRGDRYLPPMPEMLRPASAEAGPTRTAANPPKAAGRAERSEPTVVVRGQAPEENPVQAPAPSQPVTTPAIRVTLPPPEQFGLTTSAAPPAGPAAPRPTADWPAACKYLKGQGATLTRLERQEDGGYRCLCALPAKDGGEKLFEVRDAGTEQAAVAKLLEEVEQWQGRR